MLHGVRHCEVRSCEPHDDLDHFHHPNYDIWAKQVIRKYK